MVLRASDMHTLMKSLAAFCSLSVNIIRGVFFMTGLKPVFTFFWNTVHKSWPN